MVIAMKFFDDLKARITGEPEDDYGYEDEYYEEEEDGYGRSSRPDAESVTVVARNRSSRTSGSSYGSLSSYSSRNSYGSDTSYGSGVSSSGYRSSINDSVLEAEETFANLPRGPVPAARRKDSAGAYSSPSTYSASGAHDYTNSSFSTSGDVDPRKYYIDGSVPEDQASFGSYDDSYISPYASAVPTSSNPTIRKGAPSSVSRREVYLFEPDSYNQAEQIARRLRDGQPVALSLLRTRIDVARRILDFSFGAACALGGSVEKVAEKVFVLLPDAQPLSNSDLEKMKSAGFIDRY